MTARIQPPVGAARLQPEQSPEVYQPPGMAGALAAPPPAVDLPQPGPLALGAGGVRSAAMAAPMPPQEAPQAPQEPPQAPPAPTPPPAPQAPPTPPAGALATAPQRPPQAPAGSVPMAPPEIESAIEEAARETGVPANLLRAQLFKESRFNTAATGAAGEWGAAQVLPSTAANPGYGVAPITEQEARDPRQGVLFQARYLAARAKAAGVSDWSDPAQAARGLAAYNGAGPAAEQYGQDVVRMAGLPTSSRSGGVADQRTSAASAVLPPQSSPASPTFEDPYAGIQPPQGRPTQGSMFDPQWLALAQGFFSGRNFNESMGNAAGALGQVQAREQARGDRQDAIAQDFAVRRAQAKAQLAQQERQYQQGERRIGLDERRVTAAETLAQARAAGTDSRGEQVQSALPMLDPTTGQSYTRVLLRNGTQTVQDMAGNPAPPEVAQRLSQGQYSVPTQAAIAGARTGATVDAKDNDEYRQDVYAQASSARTMQAALRDMREVLRTNPNLTGESLRQRLGRSLASNLGIAIDDKDPAAISQLSNLVATGERNAIAQMAPVLRPLSNTDIPTALRGVFSMTDNPRNVEARLAEAERESKRMEDRAAEYQRFSQTPEARSRAHRAWGDEWDVTYRNRQGTEPTIQERPGGGFEPRSVPTSGGTITIRRIN